jgi:hypothetical protein
MGGGLIMNICEYSCHIYVCMFQCACVNFQHLDVTEEKNQTFKKR